MGIRIFALLIPMILTVACGQAKFTSEGEAAYTAESASGQPDEGDLASPVPIPQLGSVDPSHYLARRIAKLSTGSMSVSIACMNDQAVAGGCQFEPATPPSGHSYRHSFHSNTSICFLDRKAGAPQANIKMTAQADCAPKAPATSTAYREYCEIHEVGFSATAAELSDCRKVAR
jgi:hypothetical protein